MKKKRIVIAGFGDTGLIVAINLYKDYEVIGITPKPCLVSGQELGTRLSRPEVWKQNYLMPFERYKKLDDVKTLHGLVTQIDTTNDTVSVKLHNGCIQQEHYDALVISSGVTNGFWRNNRIEDFKSINQNINNSAQKLAKAQTIAIIGGGASGISVASNLKEELPNKQIHLFYSQTQPLPGYHPKTRSTIEAQLKQQGVQLHPNHRAIIPDDFNCENLTTAATDWKTGQPPFKADITLWAIGKLIPNNSFIPKEMLNEEGFVIADQYLRVPGYRNIFTVGDIAATDPNRSSARNAGFLTVAYNIRAHLQGQETRLKAYKATQYRWGSILGVQNNGMRVFTPTGGNIRVNQCLTKTVLFPFFVRKMIYKGVKKCSNPLL